MLESCVLSLVSNNMLEIARNFEQIAARFSPLVLIVPGLVAVLAGLFIWLGGLGARRLLVAVAGAIVGGICGLFIIGRNIVSALILAAAAAAIAIIFERIFIAILAAALAAVLGFVVLARPYFANSQVAVPVNRDQPRNQAKPLTTHQTLQTIKAYTSDFRTEIKQVCSQMPLYSWLILAALAAISILAASLLWRLTSALCWATLGTMLIFAGMILLLLYKAASSITSIYNRSLFFTTVFAAMVAFGTIEQLLLCQYAKKKFLRKKQASTNREEPEKKSLSWRNR